MLNIIINNRNVYLNLISLLVITFLFSSCATNKPQLREESPYQYDDDNKNIEEPLFRNPNLKWNAINRVAFTQIDETLDFDRNFRKLFGNPEQAYNINTFDEVPNSSWFINRHGSNRMTTPELKAGRNLNPGPDTSGDWTVFRPKVGGATPGFWIEDKHGRQYIIKFDPSGYPELATGAAAVASRYFHAAGYNTPQETIVYWRPDKLRIKEGTTYKDKNGKKVPFTPDKLNEILGEVEKNKNGYIRSLASFSLGNVKGPFSYNGTRSDDPNDWCPHQHRRELRGLYVIASLVNHYDTKDLNTLDAFETEDGRNYLRHYLLDFGSCLGADGNSPKPPIKGYANLVDLKDIFFSFITLGLKTWPWENAQPIKYSSIGYFESENFEANKFDPIIPNPAFERMTKRDAYWGAKIVMAFRDDDLKALVETGQYSNPEAEAYLLQTLIERRDKIGRHWFGKVNPLDYFDANYQNDNFILDFDDLAVKYNLENQADTKYRYSIKYLDKKVIDKQEFNESNIILTKDDLNVMADKFHPPESADENSNHIYQIKIETQRTLNKWSKPTVVYLWYNNDNRSFKLVGIEHRD